MTQLSEYSGYELITKRLHVSTGCNGRLCSKFNSKSKWAYVSPYVEEGGKSTSRKRGRGNEHLARGGNNLPGAVSPLVAGRSWEKKTTRPDAGFHPYAIRS